MAIALVRETNNHLMKERELMVAFARSINKTYIKLHKFSSVDYALVGDAGKVVAFVEVKCRKPTMEYMDERGGIFLSSFKWAQAKILCDACHVPFIFVVSAEDTKWWHVTKDFQHDGLVVGGRWDRNDERDEEPVILLRKGRFKLIGT